MKKFTAQNNKGSSYLIIIIAVVAVLVLSIGGYFLFFNKSGTNPLANLTNKCTGSEKACEIFDNINKYRESKKLSPLKYDGNICSRIQIFANDIKEIYSDGTKLNNENLKENLDKLSNDTKYRDLTGTFSNLEEDMKKDWRYKYLVRVREKSSLKTDIEDYEKSYIDSFTNSYNVGCVVISSSNVKGDYDFGVFYLAESKN